jgi:hypothetical protein
LLDTSLATRLFDEDLPETVQIFDASAAALASLADGIPIGTQSIQL